MKSPMQPGPHHAVVQRALALGRSGDPAVLPELINLLRTPSNEVQRLAVSAEEFARAKQAFHRSYCDRCFDEVFLERRNFETQVGTRLISVYPRDLPALDGLLTAKLQRVCCIRNDYTKRSVIPSVARDLRLGARSEIPRSE